MKKFLIVLAVLFGMFSANAQEAELNKYKTLFTMNFLRYFGWPSESTEGDFIIGVVRNKFLAGELRTKTGGKKFGYQTIKIVDFSSVDDITSCQILYVDQSANYSKNADLISQKTGKGTLIITETPGAITKGSVINFVIVDDKLKFEISQDNADNKGLKVNSALLSMNNAIQK